MSQYKLPDKVIVDKLSFLVMFNCDLLSVLGPGKVTSSFTVTLVAFGKFDEH